MDKRESSGSEIGKSVSRILLAAVEARTALFSLLEDSSNAHSTPTAPSYLLLHHSAYHTTSLTLLLEQNKHRWLESARFWTHPIQRAQELHQDEGRIF